MAENSRHFEHLSVLEVRLQNKYILGISALSWPFCRHPLPLSVRSILRSLEPPQTRPKPESSTCAFPLHPAPPTGFTISGIRQFSTKLNLDLWNLLGTFRITLCKKLYSNPMRKWVEPPPYTVPWLEVPATERINDHDVSPKLQCIIMSTDE